MFRVVHPSEEKEIEDLKTKLKAAVSIIEGLACDFEDEDMDASDSFEFWGARALDFVNISKKKDETIS